MQEWLGSLNLGFGVDLGAGLGPYRQYAIRLGHDYLALDFSRRMLRESMRGLRKSKRFDAVQADLLHLPLVASCADWLLMTRVLSTIQRPVHVIHECARVLKPNGQLLITDVHPGHPYDVVSIPVGKTIVKIPAYKHAVARVVRSLAETGALEVVSQREFQSVELARDTKRQFRKLYETPTTPVFYALVVRKRP